jgi:hypothetical protein
LKPTKVNQKLRLSEPRVEHAAGHLRQPVVESRHDREHDAADQHVVKMGHDEIRVMHLPVERNHRDHHAGHSPEHKDHDEADHVKSIGVFRGGRRPHSVAIQAKICTALAIATIRLAAAKKCIDSSGNPVAYMW